MRVSAEQPLVPSEWCSPHGWAQTAGLCAEELPHLWKQLALGTSHLHLILQTHVAKCTWPWWALPGLCVACLGSALCHSLGLSASETLHLEREGWTKPEHALVEVGLKKGRIWFFITLYFCPIGFYALHGTPKALTSVVPSALQHSLTNWKLSLYNSDLYYRMNGAPAFRNYHLQ